MSNTGLDSAVAHEVDILLNTTTSIFSPPFSFILIWWLSNPRLQRLQRGVHFHSYGGRHRLICHETAARPKLLLAPLGCIGVLLLMLLLLLLNSTTMFCMFWCLFVY